MSKFVPERAILAKRDDESRMVALQGQKVYVLIIRPSKLSAKRLYEDLRSRFRKSKGWTVQNLSEGKEDRLGVKAILAPFRKYTSRVILRQKIKFAEDEKSEKGGSK